MASKWTHLSGFNPNLLKKKHKKCVLFTDLEPDDLAALKVMRKQLVAFASSSSLMVVVGEGRHSKVLLAQVILESLGIRGARVVQGNYSDKIFPATMFNAFGLSPNAILADMAPNPKEITNFLVGEQSPLLVIMKPPQELPEIDKEILEKCTAVVYGSFNLRSLGDARDPITRIFNEVIEKTILYESYLVTVDKNSISKTNSSLFSKVDAIVNQPSPFREFWVGFKNSVHAWNGATATKSLAKVSKLTSEMIPSFNEGNWDDLREKKVDIERALKIVYNVLEGESKQMVFADVALATVMCSMDAVPGNVGKLMFLENGYTKENVDPTGRVFIIGKMDFEKLASQMIELLFE